MVAEQAVPQAAARKMYGSLVQVPKAAELVAASIRRQIVRGEIGDGEALPPEAELISQFQVSRPTLREALRVLESERLISVRRGAQGGATAHRMQVDVVSRYAGFLLQSRGTTLSDVYQARVVFEPACVRTVAEIRTETDLQALRETLAREQEALSSDHDLAARAGFHQKLVELCGNKTLILFSELLSDILLAAAAAEYRVGVDQRRAVQRHSDVLQLIEQQDGDAAQHLWREHLEATQRRVLTQLGSGTKIIDLLD